MAEKKIGGTHRTKQKVRDKMERVVKITIICSIEIDDEVDVTKATELYDALKEAVEDDLFSTEYLDRWDELRIEDMGEV